MTTTEKPATLQARLAAAVPEADDLTAAIEVARAVAVPTTDTQRARRQVVAALAAEVQDTGKWPEDAAERWLTAQREAETAGALAEMRHDVAEHLRALHDEAQTDALEPKIAVLVAELDEVVNRAAELDGVLGPVTNADSAIGSGAEAVEAWRELGGLVRRLTEVLRTHHRLVMRRTSGDLADLYAETVPVRNGVEMHRVVDRAGQPVYLDAARLRTLATTEGLELWLPTYGELQRESDQRESQADELPMSRYQPTTRTWDEEAGNYVIRPPWLED